MLIAALVFLAILAALSALVAWKLADGILHPRVYAYETVVDEEIKRGHFTRDWYDANVRLDECTIRSAFDYELHCAVWPREDGTSFPDGRRRVAVLVHGFSYCLLGQIKYASLFHEMGFDCVLYDHRNHGLSGHAPTTMGALEAKDLATVCAWARERFGEDAVLGTLGESMGAATVMLHAKNDQRLAFVVEDCGFSDLRRELAHVMRTRFHLPVYPALPIASLLFRLRGGVFFRDVQPVSAVKDCAHVPMLFIHGDADELVPCAMMQACYDAKAGEKEAWLVPGARHADCFRADTQGYRAHLRAFLSRHAVIEPNQAADADFSSR